MYKIPGASFYFQIEMVFLIPLDYTTNLLYTGCDKNQRCEIHEKNFY